MKKTIVKFGSLILLAGSLFFASCTGTYYVADQPAEPYYVRPAVPYQGAIWIDGEYVLTGGRYHYVNGYWARPRAGRVYYRGNWSRGPRGYYWHRGYWR